MTVIIINHAAARVRRLWPEIKRKLDASGVEYQAYETTARGDATSKTRAFLRSGIDSIVVVGGDGTLSEAAEGFFEFNDDLDVPPTAINPSATLGVLPAGTGDDFARGLAGTRAPLQTWIDKFVAHASGESQTLTVDVLYGRCNGYEKPFICLNASTMGIGGETGARVAAQGSLMRRLSGEVRFTAAAIGALAAWRERRVRLTVDDDAVIEGPMNLVGVANGLYAGGGMMLSPRARLDDGKLDVVTASGLNRLQVMRELPRIHHGGHVANAKVRIVQGSHVRIETFTSQDALLIEADGNVRGRTPVEFRIMPRALRFVVNASKIFGENAETQGR